MLPSKLLRIVAISLSAVAGACLLAPESADASVEVREVDAAVTDPQIDVPGIGSHYVALDVARPASSHLLLFFPGTTASPSMYGTLLRRAAALGHRVVGLSYLNRESVNFDYCPGQLNTRCHEDVRIEVLTGDDRSPLLTVTRPNSAYYRLVALLKHLDRNHPEEGWAQFLDGDQPRWERIIVSGQSQGGGHAALTAKMHRVARAVLLSATEPAPWTLEPSQTPVSRYFGLVHMLEPIQPPIINSWNNLGLPGTLVDVDQQPPPYGGSQRLSASRTDCSGNPATSGFYHNCTSVDGWMPPPDADGVPAYQDAWDYLYTLPTSTGSPSPVFIAGRIGDDRNSYIDPEIYSAGSMLTFQDQAGGIYVADIDPTTGAFRSGDGRESRLDSGAWPVSQTFNGPEFGIDAGGWAVYYTKANGGVASLWRATRDGVQPLTSGSRRQTVLASKDDSAAQTRLLFIRGTLDAGELAWMDEDTTASETLLGAVDDGVRWIEGTRSFARVISSGAEAGQVALVDTVAGSVRTITRDAGAKSFAVGFRAPENGRMRLLALVDAATAIGIWEDRGGAHYERIATIVPGGLAGRTLGSPEPFVGAGASYVSFVVREGAGLPGEPAQVWLARTDGSGSWRCDDGASGLSRSDPETLVLGSRVFVYYNVITAGQYQLYRCGSDLALAPPSVVVPNQRGLTGTWWQPSTSGQGFSVDVIQDPATPGQATLALGWYTYAFDPAAPVSADKQRWYSLSGTATSAPGPIELTIYASEGGLFASPPQVAAMPVGTAQIEFADCVTAQLTFQFNGAPAGSAALQRFAPNVACTPSGTPPTTDQDALRSGSWFDPNTAGQGLFLELYPAGPAAFGGWYTYAPAGRDVPQPRQRWYSVQSLEGGYVPGNPVVSLGIYETIGGEFNVPVGPGTMPQTRQVGSATIDITSCTTLQMRYSFSAGSSVGLSGTMNLVRAGPAPSGCL